jgi:hypothetical protein
MDGMAPAGNLSVNGLPAGSLFVGEEHLDANGHGNNVRRTCHSLMDI